MSLVTFDVPREYSYVLLSATGSLFLSVWHGVRVGPFRKAAGVPYPYQYASQEQITQTADANRKQAMHLFNCAQRAHYNFMENHTNFLVALLIAGVRKPVPVAIMGGLWCVGRVMYALGYTRKDKQNGMGRLIGSWSTLIQLVLMGMAGWDSWKLLSQ